MSSGKRLNATVITLLSVFFLLSASPISSFAGGDNFRSCKKRVRKDYRFCKSIAVQIHNGSRNACSMVSGEFQQCMEKSRIELMMGLVDCMVDRDDGIDNCVKIHKPKRLKQ